MVAYDQHLRSITVDFSGDGDRGLGELVGRFQGPNAQRAQFLEEVKVKFSFGSREAEDSCHAPVCGPKKDRNRLHDQITALFQTISNIESHAGDACPRPIKIVFLTGVNHEKEDGGPTWEEELPLLTRVRKWGRFPAGLEDDDDDEEEEEEEEEEDEYDENNDEDDDEDGDGSEDEDEDEDEDGNEDEDEGEDEDNGEGEDQDKTAECPKLEMVDELVFNNGGVLQCLEPSILQGLLEHLPEVRQLRLNFEEPPSWSKRSKDKWRRRMYYRPCILSNTQILGPCWS